ncbi:MAG: PEP/pyruvate-binding domain-containing protein [Vicinamibacterales bacterium]
MASSEIKGIIRGAPVPSTIQSEVAAAFRRVGAAHVAVRSSATAEDLAEASFAGQQSSFLNVTEPGLTRSVQECWASFFEPQAIAYRRRRGFEDDAVGIAVVVQQMVQSNRAGVMFTMHPVTGDRGKIVIEAVYGLGEACVSGQVTPDMYIVDKPTLRIDECAPAEQERELVRNPDATTGYEYNHWVPVPTERRARPKLNEAEIQSLATLGRRIEEHYGAPQDIEWAECSGVFYVVQSRPVTTAF